MRKIETKNYTRISKATARKLYNAGEEICILPCKMNPENMWWKPMVLQIDEENGASFDGVVNAATFYNCNYETGYYLAFYKEV